LRGESCYRLLATAFIGISSDQDPAADSHQHRADDRRHANSTSIRWERTASHWSMDEPTRQSANLDTDNSA
jgi:hypothetical protein